MVSVTDSDLATCSGPADAGEGGVSNCCRPSQDEAEYLCYFMHRLLDFRHPEIRSLVSLLDSRDNRNSADVNFELPCGGSYLSPFWYVRLPSEALARSIAQRSLLVKGFLELWGEGETWDKLIASVRSFPIARRKRWTDPSITFKFVVDGWGKAIKQQDQIAIMHKFQFLGLQGPIKMHCPDLTLRIIVADSSDNNGLPGEVPYRIYFGREVACTDRSIIYKYGLPHRKYLGPTSMDTEMAFIMCNQGQVKRGDLVYDPFVGTGSILVAAAHFGAHTMGADIDIRVVRDGKLNKSGQQMDVWENFRDYNLTPPVGLLRADAHRLPFRSSLQEVFDAIICDPPYGVRAGGKKSVAKEHKVKCSETHIPSTDPYSFEECLKDLLHLAAKHLKLGARLVFFLPSAPGLDKVAEATAHPMLTLLENSEQPLTTRYSRRLVTLCKTAAYDEELERKAFAEGAPLMTQAKSIHERVYESQQKARIAGGNPHLQRYRGKLV
ncbi:hypothetical protein ABBQ32_001345 [Trebouxia sp. C0010 RCD-2024]